MTEITITEALAEIPTIEKRIEKKREFIMNYLFRKSSIRDPHEKDGGSSELIARERQAISDLHERLIKIRSVIQNANSENTITVGDETKSITHWLTWKREIAPKDQYFLKKVSEELQKMRNRAMNEGVGVTDKDSGFSSDYVVNINEHELSKEIEELELILGTLDGQLSLKNATIKVKL